MESTTELSNGNSETWQHSTPLTRRIGEQLAVLAEAFGESLTTARIKLYAENLADIDQARLEGAFLRAVRELKYFPKIAELRELAGGDKKLRPALEAEQAWQAVERDLAHRGRNARAALSDRIEYAVRCAGGRLSINACLSASVTTEQFTKKAFVEGFANYEVAERLGLHELAEPVRSLLGSCAGDRARLQLIEGPKGTIAPTWKPPKAIKAIPEPLTTDGFEARRAKLAKQAEELKARFGS